MDDPSGRSEPSHVLALDWQQLAELAQAKQWERLQSELNKRLDEEELKLNRNGIGVNFSWLGWKILFFAAALTPQLRWTERLNDLEKRAHLILGRRHMLLDSVNQQLEKIQALLAINTSAAWTELAALMRRDLGRLDWALDAANVALEKDKKNEAAMTVKIAIYGDLGEYAASRDQYDQMSKVSPDNSYANAAMAKIEEKEGSFRDALEHARNAFKKKQSPPLARLIANIYLDLDRRDQAHKWLERAEMLEGPIPEELTDAHARGLVTLAREKADTLKGTPTKRPKTSKPPPVTP